MRFLSELDARDWHGYGGMLLVAIGTGLAWRPEGALIVLGAGLFYFAARG